MQVQLGLCRGEVESGAERCRRYLCKEGRRAYCGSGTGGTYREEVTRPAAFECWCSGREPSNRLLLEIGFVTGFACSIASRMCCICVHVCMQADESTKEVLLARDAAAGLETVVSDEDGWHSVMSSRCA